MDSSVALAISSTANELNFKAPYLRQNWSLPDSIIYYLAKNRKSPKCYQKLIQSCKYFFSKNPLIVCSSFTFYGSKKTSQIELVQNAGKKAFDLKNISHTFWITSFVYISDGIAGEENVISSLIPYIYQCDVKDLDLRSQLISFNELLFLASKAKKICLSRCAIKDEEKSVVFVEKIIEAFVKARTFNFDFKYNDPSISSETAKNLIKIPRFSTIRDIYFFWISEIFDIETFYVYMKKNKYTYFNLRFNDSISELYENRLKEIVDEILGKEDRDYKTPIIMFDGLDYDKILKLNVIASWF